MPAPIEPVPTPVRVTPLNRLGQHPNAIDCDFCKRQTRTRIEKTSSSDTMLVKAPGKHASATEMLIGYIGAKAYFSLYAAESAVFASHAFWIQVQTLLTTAPTVTRRSPLSLIVALSRCLNQCHECRSLRNILQLRCSRRLTERL